MSYSAEKMTFGHLLFLHEEILNTFRCTIYQTSLFFIASKLVSNIQLRKRPGKISNSAITGCTTMQGRIEACWKYSSIERRHGTYHRLLTAPPPLPQLIVNPQIFTFLQDVEKILLILPIFPISFSFSAYFTIPSLSNIFCTRHPKPFQY